MCIGLGQLGAIVKVSTKLLHINRWARSFLTEQQKDYCGDEQGSHRLHLTLIKCTLLKRDGAFLWHIISGEGESIDPFIHTIHSGHRCKQCVGIGAMLSKALPEPWIVGPPGLDYIQHL